MNPSRGFSLIELMVVVAIIGILSMIAIPSYKDYAKRARFTEIISATEPFKIAVSLALQQGYAFKELDTGNHGIPTPPHPTKNLAKIKVEKGMITAIGTALVDNATYILKPNMDGSEWSVEGSCIENGFCEAS